LQHSGEKGQQVLPAGITWVSYALSVPQFPFLTKEYDGPQSKKAPRRIFLHIDE
jgi:hypothetical protein